MIYFKIYLWFFLLGNILMLPILDGLMRHYQKHDKLLHNMHLMYKGLFIANLIISPFFIFFALVINSIIIKIMFKEKLSYTNAINFFFEQSNYK